MPRNTRSGTSYDGHADVSPDDRSQPEWVPADEVSRETEQSTAVSEPVDAPRKPGRPKGSKNKTVSAGPAEGEGKARA